MTQGWHNESERHQLASKGIETKDGNATLNLRHLKESAGKFNLYGSIMGYWNEDYGDDFSRVVNKLGLDTDADFVKEVNKTLLEYDRGYDLFEDYLWLKGSRGLMSPSQSENEWLKIWYGTGDRNWVGIGLRGRLEHAQPQDFKDKIKRIIEYQENDIKEYRK